MIKVGVIDSGINAKAINNNVIHRVCVKGADFYDKNGHGTMCAYIIEKYSRQEIEFYSYKIFGEKLCSTRGCIIKALQYAVNDNLDVLNMSLSIDASCDEQFKDLFEKLLENGTKVIASRSKKGLDTLLDEVNSVVIVEGCDFLHEKYKIITRNRILCSREPFLCKYDQDMYSFFGGNSKATALYTALYIKDDLKNQDYFKQMRSISVDDIEQMLFKLAQEVEVDVNYLRECEDWDVLGNYFEMNLINNIVNLLGRDYIDESTIYYSYVNSYKALKKYFTKENY